MNFFLLAKASSRNLLYRVNSSINENVMKYAHSFFMCLITMLSGKQIIMKRLLKVINRFNAVLVDFFYKKRVFPEILMIHLKKYH